MTERDAQMNEAGGKVAVCLWFYSRAGNVREILSRVAAYRPQRLYLVSDGPNPAKPEDAVLVRQARQAAQEAVNWACDVRMNYADANLGAKQRIVSGIDWVFQQEESAIFLEDDTIPDPSFFPFCEVLLEHYRDDVRVMLISGSNPLSGRVACPNGYLFSRFFHIWGWATWRRVWRQYDAAIAQWPEFKVNSTLRALYGQEGMIAWIARLFDEVHAGRIETWDVQLFFTCLFNNGLAIVPGKNLVSNVGYDGLHYSRKKEYRLLGIPVESIAWEKLSHPRYIHPSFTYDNLFMQENFPLPPSKASAKPSMGGICRRLGRRVISMCKPWYWETLWGAWWAWQAHARALRYGLRGNDFYRLGRSMGWKMLPTGSFIARQLLWTPVSSTRYFEFDFARRALAQDGFAPRRCLDVSSPFLFSFDVARRRPEVQVRMLNPDPRDWRLTRLMATRLGWPGIEPVGVGVEALDDEPPAIWDAVWSLSVIEHVAGAAGDDRDAVRRMWQAVRPGGRLILTVPTDRQAWDEYRESDEYGTQAAPAAGRRCFFQRFYDEEAIAERIVRTIGVAPARQEWFGEKSNGHFHAYVARWRREGTAATLDDPLDVAANYQIYPSFAAMPGAGVCGLLFRKPEAVGAAACPPGRTP